MAPEVLHPSFRSEEEDVFHQSSTSSTDKSCCIPMVIPTMLRRIYPSFHPSLLGMAAQKAVGNPEDSVGLLGTEVLPTPEAEPSNAPVMLSGHFGAGQDQTLHSRIHCCSPLTAPKPQHTAATSSADFHPLGAVGKSAPRVWVLPTPPEHEMSRTAPGMAASGRWEGRGTSLFTRAILVVTRPTHSSSCGCRERGTKRDHCCLQRKQFSPQPSQLQRKQRKRGKNIPC